MKCPVANPGKFVCGAGNHKVVLGAGWHPRRLGFLFKMTNAAAGESDGVTLRWPERTTFHEAESPSSSARQARISRRARRSTMSRAIASGWT